PSRNRSEGIHHRDTEITEKKTGRDGPVFPCDLCVSAIQRISPGLRTPLTEQDFRSQQYRESGAPLVLRPAKDERRPRSWPRFGQSTGRKETLDRLRYVGLTCRRSRADAGSASSQRSRPELASRMSSFWSSRIAPWNTKTILISTY